MCRSKAFACAKCFPQNLQFFNETSKLSSVEFDFPFCLNADNTEANIEVKREEKNIDFLDGIDRYFTEKAAEIDKECHIKEQNGKSNSTDDSLEVSLKNCKFCGKHFTRLGSR
jgi:hypothetical protein